VFVLGWVEGWVARSDSRGFEVADSVKLVVASAVTEEGEQVYPRTWNHDFIQLPMVRKDKQRRPSVTDAALKEILSNTKKRKHLMLFSLLGATGLIIFTRRSQGATSWFFTRRSHIA
jgi:hypothetical protein